MFRNRKVGTTGDTNAKSQEGILLAFPRASPMSVACQQLFDRHKIPLATSTLSLYLEFDLTDVPDHASLRAKDHQAACDEACRVSGLRPPSVVVARALTTHKAGDIEEAHSLPYYSDPWLTDPAHEIRIEFLYR
jgi:hypothetical protein